MNEKSDSFENMVAGEMQRKAGEVERMTQPRKRAPYTHDQLKALIPVIEKRLEDVEDTEGHEVTPLPPMTEDECRDYFNRLLDIAATRPLTREECFIHGQLLSVFQQANYAYAKGYKGRFFVVPEEALHKLMASNE